MLYSDDDLGMYINGKEIKFERSLFPEKFKTEKDTQLFAKIFRKLAAVEMKKFEDFVRKHMESKDEERIKHLAREYFLGGGVAGIRDIKGKVDVYDEAKRLYAIRKDNDFLNSLK